MSLERNIAFIDGSSTGIYGYYLEPEKKTFLIRDHPVTNNQAEWLGFYALIVDLPLSWEGTVYSDSLLVVNQFNGVYRLKNTELIRLAGLCKSLIQEKDLKITLAWVPREKNIFGKIIEKELMKERKQRWERKQLQKSYL